MNADMRLTEAADENYYDFMALLEDTEPWFVVAESEDAAYQAKLRREEPKQEVVTELW